MVKKSDRLRIIDRPPTTLDYALAYAALGWAVFPVWGVDSEGRCRCGEPNNSPRHSVGKHPNEKLCPDGHLNATVDADKISGWWGADPDNGIGVSLAASGLIALDIDPRNGGKASLAAIEAEHGVLHSDVTAKTQGGGEHRIFVANPEERYPKKLGAGLDIKHHGYLCVAPTLGPLGPYQWVAGASPISASNPAAPSPLPDYIRSRASPVTEYSLVEKGGVPVATAQTFDDLRSALKTLSADDYDQWVNVGMALKPYGENGYAVWTEWSKTSPKFHAAEQRRKWEHDIEHPRSLTYRSIFRAAMDAGWVNSPAPIAPAEAHTPLPPLYSLAEYDLNNVPRPGFLIPDWLPQGYAVLFSGHGGAGKSSVMLQLCALLAAGAKEVLGQEMSGVPLRVVYVSGEDDTLIVLNRIKSVLALWPGLDHRALTDNFRFFDAAVLKSACLVGFDQRSGRAVETPLYLHLQELCRGFNPALIVLDNNSIFFGGNEIDRTQVQTYIYSLLNLNHGSSVITLHHMDKASLSREDGEGWSGSTQWHNAVRARWSLSNMDDELTLYLRKSNYGLDGWRAKVDYDKAVGAHRIGQFNHLSKADEKSLRGVKKRSEGLQDKSLQMHEDRIKLMNKLRDFEGTFPSKNNLAASMLTRRDFYWALITNLVAEGVILELPVPPGTNVPMRQTHYLSPAPSNLLSL